MALLPLDFVPVEFSHGMSFVTALVLVGFGATVYYTIRWLHSRISEIEKTTVQHGIDIAVTDQSSKSIARSVDTIRKSLENATDRIEDRFQQIQNSIDTIIHR